MYAKKKYGSVVMTAAIHVKALQIMNKNERAVMDKN